MALEQLETADLLKQASGIDFGPDPYTGYQLSQTFTLNIATGTSEALAAVLDTARETGLFEEIHAERIEETGERNGKHTARINLAPAGSWDCGAFNEALSAIIAQTQAGATLGSTEAAAAGSAQKNRRT